MMWGLFNSVCDVATNVAKVAVAPVKVAVDITAAVTKPIADAADEIVKEIKEALK